MLDKVAMAFLILGLCTSLMIIKDMIHHPSPVRVMNLVWPVTGLYMPFVGWIAWWYFGRQRRGRAVLFPHRPGLRRATPAGVFASTSLCACGGAIGAMLAVALLPVFQHFMPSSPRLCHALLSFPLALLGGLLLQSINWHQTGQLSWPRAVLSAVKTDLFSLIAWQLGVFLYFELAYHFVLHGTISPRLLPCWFMLQIAFLIGFIFAWPANKVLLDKGLKQGI